MSHKATNWAFEFRELADGPWRVLMKLADRHSPDNGCFPSQVSLAYDCNIGRSTLNRHLTLLETEGYLTRIQRIDPKTQKQLATRYILCFTKKPAQEPSPEPGHGFDDPFREGSGGNPGDKPPETAEAESQKPAEPSPENRQGRVPIRDSNPVREPEKKKKAGAFEFSQKGWEDLLRLAGQDLDDPGPWWRGPGAADHVRGWLDEYGFDEADVLAIAAAARQGHEEPLKGPKGLDDDMRRAHKAGSRRRSASPAKTGTKEEAMAFYAEWINGDRHLPANAISDRVVGDLIQAGLVTEGRVKSRLGRTRL